MAFPFIRDQLRELYLWHHYAKRLTGAALAGGCNYESTGTADHFGLAKHPSGLQAVSLDTLKSWPLPKSLGTKPTRGTFSGQTRLKAACVTR
ncbi:hypothetical protein [Novipirellula caenicola]|uniref:hypothetical protein n=1 Tax=Novipirellula caenicola TaxID=1536901 RepID=UPI0031E8C975